MANATADYGFVPYKNFVGEIRNFEAAVLVAAGDLFVGDAVEFSGSGDSQGRPSIAAAAAAAARICGVIVGFKASGPDGLATQFIASADTGTAIVVPTLSSTLFRVNANGSEGAAIEDIGLSANHVAGAGDTLTGRSGFSLDMGTGGGGAVDPTANSLSWLIFGFDRRADNTFSSTVATNTIDVDILVICKESYWNTASQGI